MKEQVQALVEKRIKNLKELSHLTMEETRDHLIQKRLSLQERGGDLAKVSARGACVQEEKREQITDIVYEIHWRYSIKQGEHYYVEEELERRKASFSGNTLVYDGEILVRPKQDFPKLDIDESNLKRKPIYYDRRKAVQYAERWWNSFNPDYPTFTDDCTNYISQCLFAGDIPMWGAPVRTKGWWIKGNSWSYSWSVAHAFQLLLKGVSWTREVSDPRELMLGDIICYDFEGDGRFNHNTIVTGWDAAGMPLVNAHTTNSRQRYWDYEDSTAYTPNIQYKFFHILSTE